MRKLSVLVGLCLGASIAHAQSKVTIYGILDTGLLYTSKPPSSAGKSSGQLFGLNDSGELPSQFGFMGEEDLGGGYKAKFNLDSGINVDTGAFNNSNGNLFGRQAWVGLAGHFGEVHFGQQYSPFFNAIYESDPRSASDFGSGLINWTNNVLTTGTGGFSSNAITYISPEIAGFTGKAMFVLGGVAGSFSAGRQYSGSLKWEHDNLRLEAALYDGNSRNTDLTSLPRTYSFSRRLLAVGYKFGSVTAKAVFYNYKVAGSFNNNIYSGGFDWAASPYWDVNSGVYFTSDRDHPTNHSLMASMGVQYYLSRRTRLYTQVGFVNNHGAMNTGLVSTDLPYGVAGTTYGVNIGMIQTF